MMPSRPTHCIGAVLHQHEFHAKHQRRICMIAPSFRFALAGCAGLVLALSSGLSSAQQPAGGAAPAAAPAAPPSWQQGRSTEQASSPLHPFAPHMTGRPSGDLPLDKLKVPAGFKVEVWVDGIPEARSLALGDKGTVFVSNRNAKSVYAVVDN